ncbi:protein KRI1-like [Melia azedarach]|uniref:Protein KRI1-like n=1 Tax=Melia azedarach TaxID=155640 RepID=A0ACC1YDK6_MELAZ|nr:protein KRI1-like [Melia azedarach]
MGRLKLFEDDDNDDVSKIEINKEYAKRLEHNKKREELQRYEEMKKKGLIEESDEELDDESSESDEDSSDIIGNSKKDAEFFNALLLVKKQDPSLKEKDINLFDSESDGSEGEEEQESQKTGKKEKEKKKAMYLKDVMAKHLIEEGPEFQEENEEDLGEKKKKKKSYSEEQEEIRKAFLDAVKEAEASKEEDDGFLKEKKKEDDDEDFEDADNEVFVRKLDEYFGQDGELDEKKMFLKEFFKNKMWIDKDKKDKEVGIDEVEDLLREDDELERQELYETTYRHEEGVEDRVMGHSRKVEGSVRKKDNARKGQRKSKEERMKIAEMERKEELKHLKNLKKKEMKERMKKVMAIAGFKEEEELPLNLKDLDDEFDPEEYDRMMKSVFDEKYYGAEDLDPQFGHDRDEEEGDIEKPDFDKEDELLGLPKGWDVIESGNGFKAARERSLKREQKEVYEESKRKRKRKMSLVQRAREEMLEEFYKLDYEDTIGDLKTRFKYAKVKPNRYGLKTEEILMMDEKDLNQYVSVKKLAPYREKEWKVQDSKRYQQKLKNKELILGQKSDDRKGGKRKRLKDDAEKSALEIGAKGDEKARQEEPNADVVIQANTIKEMVLSDGSYCNLKASPV